MDEAVTITIDEKTAATLQRALDTYQRILMGQWREIAERCGEVLGENAGPWSKCADELMEVRTRWAADDALKHPNASLSIAAAGEDARRSCDLWRALGGGMAERRDMKLSDAVINVQRTPHVDSN